LGQKERAKGAVAEVKVAAQEKYLLAPQDMQIETINVKVGELAMAGYPIVNGTIHQSTYFRFTIPENQVGKIKNGSTVNLVAPYLDNKMLQGKVVAIKALNSYANIASAYPDFDSQMALFEVKVVPEDQNHASD